MGNLAIAIVLVGFSLHAAAVKKSSPVLLKRAEKTEENTFVCPVNHVVHRINLDRSLVFCSRFNESNSTRDESKCVWKNDCNLYDDKQANTKLGVDRLTNNTLIPRGARIRPKAGIVQFHCCKEVCRYANCMREKADEDKPQLLDPKDAGSHRFIIKASFSTKDVKQPAKFESCKALCSAGGVPPPGGNHGPIPLVIAPCLNECETAKPPKPIKCKCGNNDGCQSGACVEGFCAPVSAQTTCIDDGTGTGNVACPGLIDVLTCGSTSPDTGTQYCKCALPESVVPVAGICCSEKMNPEDECVAVENCTNDVECLPGKCLCTGKCDPPPVNEPDK